MRIAYFDCIAGASGDMILAAIIDAGLPKERLDARLKDLGPLEFEINVDIVSKNGFRAAQVDVRTDGHDHDQDHDHDHLNEGTHDHVHDHGHDHVGDHVGDHVHDRVHSRPLADIKAMVSASRLSPQIKERAIAIFQRIGEVEAGIHGMPVEQVHLHELSGVDSIVDIVGTLVGLEELRIDRVISSPLPLGRGFIQGAHGTIPLPAPATLALLTGVPVVASQVDVETVTPTGAALLSNLADSFGPFPSMEVDSIGYGAGSRDLPIPNVLRLIVGHDAGTADVLAETVTMLETNIDDQSPEVYDHVMGRLFADGALDVLMQPAQMKKNRPAVLFRVFCRPADADALTKVLLLETSTLGVRRVDAQRQCLPRQERTLETTFGPVRVKVAHYAGKVVRAKPEYDDCHRLAEKHGVPLVAIYSAVDRAVAASPWQDLPTEE